MIHRAVIHRLGSLVAAILLAACSSTPSQPAPISERPVGQTPTPAPRPQPTPRPVAEAPVAESRPLGNEGEIVSSVLTPVPTAVATPAGQPVAVQPGAARSYTVQRGDTLYKIAREQGVAPRDLIAWNAIANPDDVKAGQVLQLAAPGSQPAAGKVATGVEVKTGPKAVRQPYTASAVAAATPASAVAGVASKPQSSSSSSSVPAAAEHKPVVTGNASKTAEKPVVAGASATDSSLNWGWPTAGKVTRGFTEERKGIDIAGKKGQSVVASAGGKVVYAGSGLRGYGMMVIVQHGNGYLSTYAHNSKLLVKEGDVVKKGEKIAEMGNTDTDEIKLHFEIRKFGKPVDPTKYISAE
ncbi:peptidoglycan DD-metalloendopeptidase family protein [Chitinilyticum litopenaei]|uniref:peptidoglycan DD-metalloendopeptidase family protein n=1 Tax=Chitinilyticum litopenaei TaxID=1121276 RepID=UPI000422F87C|nr:peptidoglycan DD-metalloendopeptidase family protein [Chitinilyticum litopenaei]